jgi:hypothetical protein
MCCACLSHHCDFPPNPQRDRRTSHSPTQKLPRPQDGKRCLPQLSIRTSAARLIHPRSVTPFFRQRCPCSNTSISEQHPITHITTPPSCFSQQSSSYFSYPAPSSQAASLEPPPQSTTTSAPAATTTRTTSTSCSHSGTQATTTTSTTPYTHATPVTTPSSSATP